MSIFCYSDLTHAAVRGRLFLRSAMEPAGDGDDDMQRQLTTTLFDIHTVLDAAGYKFVSSTPFAGQSMTRVIWEYPGHRIMMDVYADQIGLNAENTSAATQPRESYSLMFTAWAAVHDRIVHTVRSEEDPAARARRKRRQADGSYRFV